MILWSPVFLSPPWIIAPYIGFLFWSFDYISKRKHWSLMVSLPPLLILSLVVLIYLWSNCQMITVHFKLHVVTLPLAVILPPCDLVWWLYCPMVIISRGHIAPVVILPQIGILFPTIMLPWGSLSPWVKWPAMGDIAPCGLYHPLWVLLPPAGDFALFG